MGLSVYRWEVELTAISDDFWEYVFHLVHTRLTESDTKYPIRVTDLMTFRRDVLPLVLRSTDTDMELVVHDNGLSVESVFPVSFAIGVDFLEIGSIYASNVFEQFESEESLREWQRARGQ